MGAESDSVAQVGAQTSRWPRSFCLHSAGMQGNETGALRPACVKTGHHTVLDARIILIPVNATGRI